MLSELKKKKDLNVLGCDNMRVIDGFKIPEKYADKIVFIENVSDIFETYRYAVRFVQTGSEWDIPIELCTTKKNVMETIRMYCKSHF